nr:immunoglobulin light chain junction region [Macaca mulatta]MOV75718.1 immunoglobulin light chain junction region [Macaca mulatta]MOV75962.1 immunoglobulin light chain junction region [Macaca mulatta]MOV76153.1 immunoglobulin light chain junction region [Macaca mulatta]MOV76412.1 immunoglobulin light chain junction region [Macaca mulatta]
CQNYITSPLTF